MILGPAFAAGPSGGVDVRVVNEPGNPVPVSVEGTADVTITNIDPISVEGDVSVSELSYDSNGNLNVNIAASDVGADDVVLSEGAGTCVFGAGVGAGVTATGVALGPITAITVHASETLEIRFASIETGSLVWGARVDATGNTFSETFPFPLVPSNISFKNLSSSDMAFVWLCVTTLAQ